MAERPACVVGIWDLPAEKRPKGVQAEGVGAVVRSPGAATGLTQMGVNLRSIEPGTAGTHRHFHTLEEEWSYVLSGRGTVRIGPHRLPVAPGCFVGFPPGPRPHHFLAEGDEPLVLLEGGESRRAEDGGWYPDARMHWMNGQLVEPYVEPPPEEGDVTQVLAVDDVRIKLYQHDVDPAAGRSMRVLHKPTGLKRQAVYWARVEPRRLSTAYHTHETTDEWILVLAGRARVRVGEDRFEVGPDDFIGHPAKSAPHVMEAVEELTYLMGGQIDAEDVVTYPEAAMQRWHGKLRTLQQN